MTRLERVADIERRRRDAAGAQLHAARRELDRHREQLRNASTPSTDTEPTSGASMLTRRQAAGRMVERLVAATQAQRTVVDQAVEDFERTDRRARQMNRAAELESERQAAARRRIEERNMEDTMIGVTAGRRMKLDGGISQGAPS